MKAGSFSIGGGVTCEIDRLINTRLLIQATSGAGKSWTLRRILEQTSNRVQQFVIDPEGEFSSLRERFDYVLAARQGGDTLADPRVAKLLAERLLELGVSAILDIYELNPKERVSFVKVFLETVVDAPKSLWHPLLVVLDEAHVYCPEKGAGEAESDDAVKALATRGRKRGFCLVAATQRLAKLHKDVAAECSNKLIGRTTLDVDMKRAGAELGITSKDEILSFRNLKDGQFYAYGPAISSTVKLFTVGNVESKHPEAGSKLAAKVPPPTARVRSLLPKLSDLPAEAEARVKTEADLRKDITQLRRELTEAKRQQPKAVAAPVAKRVEVAVLKDGQVTRLEALFGKMLTESERHGKAMAMFWENQNEVADALLGALRSVEKPSGPSAVVARGGPVAVVKSPKVVVTVGPSYESRDNHRAEAGLTTPEQRVLDAIAWLNEIGVEEPLQPAVAFLARYTYDASSFKNPRGSLKTKGLIDYKQGNRLVLTPAGQKVAIRPTEVLTNEKLHKHVMSVLGTPEQRVLQPLLDVWPDQMDSELVAMKANYAHDASSFKNPRGRLKSLGLIEYPGDGFLRAADLLFPEGR